MAYLLRCFRMYDLCDVCAAYRCCLVSKAYLLRCFRMYDLCEVCAAYQSCILSCMYFKCAFKIRSTSVYEEYELRIEGYARLCTTHV